MALTAAQLVDARRFCGYGAYGAGLSDDTFNRYQVVYETLEYRLANLLPAEEVIAATYLGQLTTMEAGLVGAADNLDTDQAAVWYHNKNEVNDRFELFNAWRRKLCEFLGVDKGPALSNSAAIRFII